MRVIIVMPAYNAERTLIKTYQDLPNKHKKSVLVVDDGSTDNTLKVAHSLGLNVIQHTTNKGYGANQKTCYKEALKRKAEIIVMIHPDYQYDARLVDLLIKPIELGNLDIVYGNRIRTRREALDGGMPKIKYILNRILSLTENIVLGINLGEHLSGMRAYKQNVLKKLPLKNFSNDFVFDQQLTISAAAYGFKMGDIPVPVRYYSESSSIQYLKGAKYLIESVLILMLYIIFKLGIFKAGIFKYQKQ
jgi:glycosyltransferase involved in cell wall biosynthesis